MLTLDEVADELRVAVATLRDWILARSIPHTRLPGTRRILIPRQQLDLWLSGESDLIEKRLAGGGRVVRVRTAPKSKAPTA